VIPASFPKISAVFRDVLPVHCLVTIFVLCSCTSPCIPLLPNLRKPTRSRSDIDCFIFVCAKSVGILEELELVRLSWIKFWLFLSLGLALRRRRCHNCCGINLW
jgi:hypothetical protein